MREVRLFARVSPLEFSRGNSLAVRWLGLCAATAEDTGSLPGCGTKILRAVAKKKKKKKLMLQP